MSVCKMYCETKRGNCSDCDRQDTSQLDPRLQQYYDSGERVEVTYRDGFEDHTRFYIGRSTGFRPAWLMMLRRDSIGGFVICCDMIETITGLGEYRER